MDKGVQKLLQRQPRPGAAGLAIDLWRLAVGERPHLKQLYFDVGMTVWGGVGVVCVCVVCV
jgi:hypothetical protein